MCIRHAARGLYCRGCVQRPLFRERERGVYCRLDHGGWQGEFMSHIRRSFPGWFCVFVATAFAVFAYGTSAFAQKATLDELVSAVVRIKTHINPDGRTVENLGREREGSGVVIDEK